MSENKNEELILDDSIKQNNKGQVILGKLSGPCADFLNPTRNGRMYDESLWEKVFNNPIVNEYFEAGGIPGELDHPTDRLETCSEKIAIMMPEKPIKDKSGHLIATFDILDTPNGRIAYTLAKYGYKLGISSRGNGETYEDYNGTEHVDESSYDFQGFDLVLLPAVKAARLKMVESLQNGQTFKQAINEALEKSTPDEKKVMTETLNNLNIDYNSERKNNNTNFAANNAGAKLVNDLQESLLANQKLETQQLELQEKLSVCYAKEAKYEEDIAKYKTAIRNLSESSSNAKALQAKVTSLTEELEAKNKLLEAEQLKSKNLFENNQSSILTKEALIKKVNTANTELTEALNKVDKLNKQIETLKANKSNEYKTLEESYAEVKKNLNIKTNEYNLKLTKANNLIEQYRTTAKTAVNKYIESQAVRLGISKTEIINKLPNNYSFNDIDTICENLSSFKLKVNSLPINFDTPNTKVVMKESIEPIKPKSRFDDEVDDALIRLANLK